VTTGSGASAVAAVQFKDTSGLLTGRKNVTWTVPVSIDDTLSYGSITVDTSALTTAADTFDVTFDVSGGDVVSTIVSADPVPNATNSAITPATASANTGGSLGLTATIKDQLNQLQAL